MTRRKNLSPVIIKQDGIVIEGILHKFTYFNSPSGGDTKALVELKNGELRYFDAFMIQYVDRDLN